MEPRTAGADEASDNYHLSNKVNALDEMDFMDDKDDDSNGFAFDKSPEDEIGYDSF